MSLDAPIRRVLVATDFSTGAATALDWADAFARREHAELHLVHVLEPPLIVSPDAVFVAWTEALASQLESDVDRQLSRVSEGRTVAHRHVRSGRPELEIGACATAIEADLVVVGSRGRSGLAHVLLGSVAERVIRTAPVPVVTVPGGWTQRVALEPPVRRVLVPTDLDEHAEARVANVLRMAERLDARIDVLWVLEPTPYVMRDDALRAGIERATARELAELCARHTSERAAVQTHVRVGRPGETIVSVAAELDVDLVAMPTHGRTGTSRFFLGSVAERVASTASCPVLTLRPTA